MNAAEVERLARQAAAAHRAGRAADAERWYRAALALSADHAPSLHGLGRLAHEAGRPDLAIGLIGQAVAAEPLVARYTLSLGLALFERGHVEEARAALHVAALRDPADPEAHRALGQALARQQRWEEAEACLRTALGLAPADAATLMALGEVLRARGETMAAVAALADAVRQSPRDPLIWHALACAYGAAGAGEEAEKAFRRVARLLPNDAAAQANLGTALFTQGRLEQARESLERARILAPANAATLSSLGLVQLGLGVSIQAERTLAEAARLAPGMAGIAINHGTALAALGRRDAAEALFRAALASNPADPHARFNLATMQLAQGDLAQGWANLEARLQLGPASSQAGQTGLPEWDGSPSEAGAILIQAEQGFGDTLQFLRWIPIAAARAPLRLELPHSLHRLLRDAALLDPALFELGRVTLAAPGEPVTTCIAQVPLLSLPHRLGHAAVPSLPARRAVRTGEPSRAPRVGLVWAGSPGYQFDRLRSIPLDRFAPLAALPGIRFVSLQQGPQAAQLPPPGLELEPSGALADFAETAALIASLDLVIGVDTAIIHLAGLLAKPVWLLDRIGGDWRWQPGFNDGKAWYPSLRRFVQPAPGDWEAVIAQVAAALLSRWPDAPRPVRS